MIDKDYEIIEDNMERDNPDGIPPGFVELTETQLIQACDLAGEDSVFFDVLQLGKEYKDVGLEPIYITNEDNTMLLVSYRKQNVTVH